MRAEPEKADRTCLRKERTGFSPAVLQGGDALGPAEDPVEVGRVTETGLRGDLLDRPGGGQQQLAGTRLRR